MDHFRNFIGFGSDGTYISNYRKDPVQVAEEILSQHRGQIVELSYNEISRKYQPKFRYSQEGMFTPHLNQVKIPKIGSLKGFLKGVLTDNIEIDLGSEINKTIEIQKIVIGDKFVTEVREHNYSVMRKNIWSLFIKISEELNF